MFGVQGRDNIISKRLSNRPEVPFIFLLNKPVNEYLLSSRHCAKQFTWITAATICAASGKLLNISELQSPHLRNELNMVPTS